MENRERSDLVIIGGGPGGYVAAIRAAQLGLSTILVDKRDRLGGTCLNIGCIPSKALLDSSERYALAKNNLAEEGIRVGRVRLDLEKVMARKDAVVEALTKGVSQLMKGRNIRVIQGTGRITRPGHVSVSPDSSGEGTESLETNAILLATGSVSQELPILPLDGNHILSSTEALSLEAVPESLLVVGAGAIGLELGSVWARLGSRVTVIEILPHILPGWDKQVSDTLKRSLARQGLNWALATGAAGFDIDDGMVRLRALDGSGAEKTYQGEKVLVAVGRRPYVDGSGVEDLGVDWEDRRIRVDGRFQTSVPGVYAIGDLIAGPMLAHKAEEEGAAVAEILAGGSGHVNYRTIPNVVYTWPEAASVGKSEQDLKDEATAYRMGMFPFAANSRSLAMGESDGFVKVLADEKTDSVLGVHIVGPWASDLIMEAVIVMEFGGSAEDIARTVHPHPTLSEAMREAALAVDGRAIHRL